MVDRQREILFRTLPLSRTQLATLAEAAEGARTLLVSVSGAHLYGFASDDSDVDLRGTHLLPTSDLVGLKTPELTVDRSWVAQGVEIDLVSHDLSKFLTLLLRQNGNYLEQLYSPLIIVDSESIEELRGLVRQGTIARHAYHAYAGYARAQWREWRSEAERGEGRLKPLLYAYRVSLTGLHLLNTGEVNAHLPTLAPAYGLAHLTELIAAKTREKATVDLPIDRHDRALQALQDEMARAHGRSPLPPEPTNFAALNDFLVRMRLAEVE